MMHPTREDLVALGQARAEYKHAVPARLEAVQAHCVECDECDDIAHDAHRSEEAAISASRSREADMEQEREMCSLRERLIDHVGEDAAWRLFDSCTLEEMEKRLAELAQPQ